MELALFVIAAALSVGGAIGVVMVNNVVHAAVYLLIAMLGVAAAFVLLYAEFLALVQLLIYGGAVTMVILFALMLTRRSAHEEQAHHVRWPIAAGVSVGVFALLASASLLEAGRFNSAERSGIGLEELGRTLFEEWAIPFEVASLVLLIAVVGAIVIGRAGRAEDIASPEGAPPRHVRPGTGRGEAR
ncbi:MAG: NADH-quinone oxidoreductase subunit J [Opitutae bacterium]